MPLSVSILTVCLRTASIVRPYRRSASGGSSARISSARRLLVSQIRVFTPPGSITITSTPCPRSSRRRESLAPSSPNFEAL